MSVSYKRIESAVIHGGIYGDSVTGAVNVPIYQTATYQQPELGKNTGWEYSRTGNPTRAALESLIAELENGAAGFAFASGMAAITAALSLFGSGDKIIISSNVYGGTFRVLDKIFRNFKIGYSIEDTTDTALLEKNITSDVKAILIETPANPLLTVTDISAISAIAKKHGILLIVDNTFMTPYLQRPIELGADIVIHSATKYIGGHSDVVAGLVVVNNKELAEKIAFIQNAAGGVLAPFDSFLLIRGLKTLAVRMDRHTENAADIAVFLQNNNAVKKIYYPGLPVALDELKTVMGKKRAFIVTDKFLFENGFTRCITKKLEEIGIMHSTFSDIMPDPTLASAKAGAAIMRSFAPDVIIALGGGSAMDAAKIMWVMY